MNINFEAFARNYAKAICQFLDNRTAWADTAYEEWPSACNAENRDWWNRLANRADEAREEVEDEIFFAKRAAEERRDAA